MSSDLTKLERPRIVQRRSRKATGDARSPWIRALTPSGRPTYPLGRGARAERNHTHVRAVRT
jgi:hypothetical protein